jgi:hypothetical protein
VPRMGAVNGTRAGFVPRGDVTCRPVSHPNWGTHWGTPRAARAGVVQPFWCVTQPSRRPSCGSSCATPSPATIVVAPEGTVLLTETNNGATLTADVATIAHARIAGDDPTPLAEASLVIGDSGAAHEWWALVGRWT